MLQKSSEASIWTGDDSPQNEAADSLLESLVWIYVKRLNVYMMHGMKKNYKEVVGHSSKVRGRILFTEKVFSPKSLINPLCQWDEWTENTPLNQSILLLTKHLAKSIASLSLKGNLSSQIARLQQSVEVGKNYDPLLADVNCSRSRYQSSFIQLAKFLAQNISPAMSHGRKNQICIGLDMSQVFEAYIYGLLKRFKDQLELRKVEYQEGLRLISHVSGLEGHYAPTKAKLKNTFVDILVIDKSGKKFVLDAKYKILDDEKKSLGLANSDIYQLTTYQRIHSEQCTEAFGILIYPTSFSDPVRFFRLNAEQDVWFGSHTIDLLCDLKRSEHLIVSGLKETFRAARRLRSLES